MVSHAELLRIIRYDPETGIFTWKIPAAIYMYPGDRAGTLDKGTGRWRIGIAGRQYPASKLAWYYQTGKYPRFIVDHKNRNQADDRWENLRPATGVQSARNRGMMSHNTSGVKGVSWHKDKQKWIAYINLGGRHWEIDAFDEDNFAGAVEAATFAREFFFDEFNGENSRLVED